MRSFFIFIVLAGYFMLNGCATNMALQKGQSEIDLTEKSIALISIKISNQNKPDYQPYVNSACIEKLTGEIDNEIFDIKTEPLKSVDKKYNEFLLNFALTPGTYSLKSIMSDYTVPFQLSATCTLPLDENFEIKPKSVVYLGHIDAIIRERKNEYEEQAGSLLPYNDQYVTGFSSGTFDIAINDCYDDDVVAFTFEYPALQKVNIEKMILHPWVRPEKIVKK